MAHQPKKRSLTVTGHRTSISLEDEFWDALKDMARTQGCSVPDAIAKIDAGRGSKGLSSAVRCAVLYYYRNKS